jgi:hypothetical protein
VVSFQSFLYCIVRAVEQWALNFYKQPGTPCPRDESFLGGILPGTHYRRDASSQGRIIPATHKYKMPFQWLINAKQIKFMKRN